MPRILHCLTAATLIACAHPSHGVAQQAPPADFGFYFAYTSDSTRPGGPLRYSVSIPATGISTLVIREGEGSEQKMRFQVRSAYVQGLWKVMLDNNVFSRTWKRASEPWTHGGYMTLQGLDHEVSVFSNLSNPADQKLFNDLVALTHVVMPKAPFDQLPEDVQGRYRARRP